MQESSSQDGGVQQEYNIVVNDEVKQKAIKVPSEDEVVDYKQQLAKKDTEIMRLQQELDDKESEILKLEESLTKKKLKLKVLEELETVNKELEAENVMLDRENDDQASRYCKLKKENDELKKILKEYGIHLDLDIESDPTKERVLKSTIMDNMPQFTKYTDLQSLAPFLYKYRLLTFDEYTHITGLPGSATERVMYFYTNVLPRKGNKAYVTFYRCMKDVVQDQSSSKGHSDLLKLLGTAYASM